MGSHHRRQYGLLRLTSRLSKLLACGLCKGTSVVMEYLSRRLMNGAVGVDRCHNKSEVAVAEVA